MTNVFPLQNAPVYRFISERLKEMPLFEPSAYYLRPLDMLIVVVKNAPFNVEDVSQCSAIYRIREKRKAIAGFQVRGVLKTLKINGGHNPLDVATLTKMLALKLGGMEYLFGKDTADVSMILKTWKLSVTIKPD